MKRNRLLGIILIATLVFATAALTGCKNDKKDDKKIIVGASPTPHAEILEVAREEIEKEGYTLEIKEFDDYVKPNQALTDGDIDANFFQHEPYLIDYNKKNKTDIEVAGVEHFEALGVYKGKKKSFDELTSGDKIAVPNDTTNEARALLLLESQGIIKLKDGVGLEATKKDIVSNPKNVEIEEIDAAIIPKTLPDVALGVINGNFALGAKLTAADRIASESSDSEAALKYANIIAVNKGDKDSKKIEVLVKALHSDKVKKFIEEKYQGTVIPKFSK